MSEIIDLAALADSKVALRKPSNLADNAAELLRGMILLEKFPPGMPLPERDISAALGISRTPLREAIRLLANEGLIEYSASRRPRVADPTIDEIADYLRVQGALEGLAGELACAKATDRELNQIESMNNEMFAMMGKEESLESFKRDMAIHTAIVAAGHNQPLMETHATYNARLWRARFISSQRKISRDKTIREHQTIVDALLERDPRKASRALKTHLTTAISNISLAMKEREAEKEADRHG